MAAKTSWDWKNSSQTRDYFVGVKNKLLDKCLDNKSGWRRLSGFPLGFALPSIYIVRQTALVGEQAIKGSVNLVGGCIPGNKFSAKKGGKQLCYALYNLLKLAFSPVGVPFSIVFRPLLVAIVPDLMRVGFRSLTREEVKANRATAKAVTAQLRSK